MVCEQSSSPSCQNQGLEFAIVACGTKNPISDRLRFLVVKASGGRCQLRDISAKGRPIDVDHIIP
jgi:hypothetical protein